VPPQEAERAMADPVEQALQATPGGHSESLAPMRGDPPRWEILRVESCGELHSWKWARHR
jgi:hypothetical protein